MIGTWTGQISAGTLFLAIAAALPGCNDHKESVVSYNESIKPIWDTYCTGSGCHNKDDKAGGLILSGLEDSFILNFQLIDVPATQTAGLRINKSHPVDSVLLNRIHWNNVPQGNSPAGWRMPPNSQLPAEEQDLIGTWLITVVPTYLSGLKQILDNGECPQWINHGLMA
jgi:hypothetical protein